MSKKQLSNRSVHRFLVMLAKWLQDDPQAEEYMRRKKKNLAKYERMMARGRQ